MFFFKLLYFIHLYDKILLPRINRSTTMKQIFISSTFSDMQEERDVIQKNVLPKLRHFSRRMGHDVSVVDLRWGISGEDMDLNETMSKILSVCAEEIDSCLPYFVK